jgi:hypothetical protein
MDQHRIDGDASIHPQITSMEAIQYDFNARVNLLMPSEVWYLHHVQDSRPRDVHSPCLGDDFRLLPLSPG